MDRTAASFGMTIDCAGDGGCFHSDDDNNHHDASFDGFRHWDDVNGFWSTSEHQCVAVDRGCAHSVAYARLAYSPYSGHALRARAASAHPICEAVGQSTCTNSGTYIGRDGRHAGIGTRQSEPSGTVMLALASVSSTPFVVA